MKKILIIFTILIAFSSCKTYLDYPHENEIRDESLDFIYLNDYNEFVYKSKIDGIADTEVYCTTNFSIRLPKKIKRWKISGNEFFFEYDNKEMIYVYSGYTNVGTSGNWTLRETDNKEVYKRLNTYWDKRNYCEKNLNVNHSGRISKVYTDGKFVILLYNIKQDNFDNYLTLIKSFKCLN